MELLTHQVAVTQHLPLVMHSNTSTDSSTKLGFTTVTKVNGVRVVESVCGAGKAFLLGERVRLVLPNFF